MTTPPTSEQELREAFNAWLQSDIRDQVTDPGNVQEYAWIAFQAGAQWQASRAEHYMCPACCNGVLHASDCAVHNEPALPAGPCDCHVIEQSRQAPSDLQAAILALPEPDVRLYDDWNFALVPRPMMTAGWREYAYTTAKVKAIQDDAFNAGKAAAELVANAAQAQQPDAPKKVKSIPDEWEGPWELQIDSYMTGREGVSSYVQRNKVTIEYTDGDDRWKIALPVPTRRSKKSTEAAPAAVVDTAISQMASLTADELRVDLDAHNGGMRLEAPAAVVCQSCNGAGVIGTPGMPCPMCKLQKELDKIGGAAVVGQDAGASFQQRVQPWMMACFGAEISGDKDERNHRFFEEATELVQACGMTASEAHQLVDYTYNRPIGEPSQEVGGVIVTLAALCLAQGMDMHEAGETELARIWTKVDVIRAKQAAKPKHSPLPESTPAQAVPSESVKAAIEAIDDNDLPSAKSILLNMAAQGQDGAVGLNGYLTKMEEARRYVDKAMTKAEKQNADAMEAARAVNDANMVNYSFIAAQREGKS